MWKHLFSKTVLGAVAAAAFHVAGNVKDPVTWGESIGIVVGAWGARDAIAKNGAGV